MTSRPRYEVNKISKISRFLGHEKIKHFKMRPRALRGHPYMTSALRGGGGVSPKEDVVREVA